MHFASFIFALNMFLRAKEKGLCKILRELMPRSELLFVRYLTELNYRQSTNSQY